ncbi:MAG: TFIIB-type zinc ribbon-containing protein [Thermoplasmatota archaeon]
MSGKDPLLNCPRDGALLARSEREGVLIDRCTTCGGMWLDATELSRVAHERELEKRATRVSSTAPKSPFTCPRCNGEVRASYVGEVEVDTCTSCHGVWLDAGELEDARRTHETDRALDASRPGILSFLRRV